MKQFYQYEPVGGAAAAKRSLLAAVTVAVLGSVPALAAEPTLEQKVDILSREVEQLKTQTDRDRGAYGGRTTLGGYGELHYNNLKNDTAGTETEEFDFHRFVLFIGHKFSDRIRLFSEFELEHSLAGEGKNGEVELEQAYVEFDVGDRHAAKAGLFLVPVGILNETHEPPTFYGVERNPVENNIVPSTWWECGGAASGELGVGWSYDVALHSGLKTSAANNYRVRNGRQKCSEAAAADLAYTGRLKWTGMAGTEVGATVQRQADVTQGADSTAGAATLYEVHTAVSRGSLGVRALYARWDLDGSGPRAIGADKQDGYYVEPSWRISKQLGVFARYNEWDNTAGSVVDTTRKQVDFGVNWWPHPHVVLKADVQKQSGAVDNDGFNLGMGFMF